MQTPKDKPKAHLPTLGVLALFFGLSLILQIETLLVPPRSDSAAFLYMGARQEAGQMPGRDLWDNKLPLIYLVGRAAMATEAPRVSLWILEAALTALGAFAVFSLLSSAGTPHSEPRPSGSDQRSQSTTDHDHEESSDSKPGRRAAQKRNRPALAAGILLCIISGSPAHHAGGFMTEIYAMPLSAIAAWLAWQTFTQQRPPHLGIVAGLCGALAISFRLPLALSAATVLLACLLAARPIQREPSPGCARAIPACIATHALGALLGLLLVFAHPLYAGYLQDCLDAAILWPLGLTGEHIPGPLTLSTSQRLADFAQDFSKLGYLHISAIAGLALALRGPHRRLAQMIGIWYVTAIASAALGWASYAHYQYVAFAPACAAVGLLLHHLKPGFAPKVAVALLTLTAAVVSIQGGKELSRHATLTPNPTRSNIVDYIQTHAEPTDTVYIWAWNRNAPLLYELDRPPGNRHFMAHSYFNMDLALFDEMVDAFTADPPTWLIIDRNRNKPSPIGPAPTSWHPPIPARTKLRTFIETHYHKALQHENLMILRTP